MPLLALSISLLSIPLLPIPLLPIPALSIGQMPIQPNGIGFRRSFSPMDLPRLALHRT